jgi:Kef-type K+ transport system membrane component KefB
MNVSDWLRQWGPGHPPDVLMSLAAVLVVASLVGEAIARTTRLPRMIGYTLAGWLAAVTGLGVDLPFGTNERLLVDLALALLLFEIGSQVRLRWLRNNPGLLATSLLESLIGAVAVYAALRWFDMPPLAAAACAVLTVPASAAVAGRVALELRAGGQVTQRMTLLTALNTLYGALALIAFNAMLRIDRMPEWELAVQAMAIQGAAALVLAALLAVAVGRVARRLDLRSESAVLLVLGLVLLAVSTARWLDTSTLLVPLLAGILLRNTSDRPWAWPRHFGTAGGVLVLMLFVIVGASWSPAALAAGGAAAVVLLLARGVGKSLSVLCLSRWSHLSTRQGLALGLTLSPLSATSLVMLSELHGAHPELGQAVMPVVLTAVVLVELLGPIAVQLALRLAGDLPAAAGKPKDPS